MRIVEDGAPTHERDLVDECHLVRGSRSESETAGEFPEPRAQLQALVPRRDHNLVQALASDSAWWCWRSRPRCRQTSGRVAGLSFQACRASLTVH